MNKGKSKVMEDDGNHQDNRKRGVTDHPSMSQTQANSSISISSTVVPSTFGGQPSAAATHPLAAPPPQPEPLLLQHSVVKIMRKALPRNARIGWDAKDFMQDCVSNFIIHVFNEAKGRCLEDRRSTVTADDILRAFENLGLHNYSELLSVYLDRYRESTGRGQVAGDAGVLEPRPPARSAVPAVDPAAGGGEGEVGGFHWTMSEMEGILGMKWDEGTGEVVNDDAGSSHGVKGGMSGGDGDARV